MITLYLCTKDSHVLQRWSQIKNVFIEPCNDLNALAQKKSNALVMVHLMEQNPEQLDQIHNLIKQGVKVLALSNMPSVVEATQLFKWGIKGYLNTFTDLLTLEQAIKVIEQDHIWLGQTVMSALIQNITQTPNVTNNDWEMDLSERHLATAKAILKGQTNKEIADTLSVSERTVKSYVQQLLEKFDAKDRLGLVLKIHNWPKA